MIESDAANHRFVIDSGYDLDDDRRIVEAAIATSADCQHDLSFVYLSQPDLSGHLHGWDSAEYVAAATRSDTALARLLDAVGPQASVLVTTDYGGVGSDHTDEVPDVLETFMVVRAPGRIQSGSGWSSASPLDIAPTVADLCGFEPDHRWQGSSLLGRELPLVDVVLELLAATADETYGERLSMLDHALQSAAGAAADDAGDEMVLACLLHDLGHILGRPVTGVFPATPRSAPGLCNTCLTRPLSSPFAAMSWPSGTAWPSSRDYHDHLSKASQMSLAEQGGPLCADDAEVFRVGAFAAEAMRLRAYDDDGKVDGLVIPPLETYRGLLSAALVPRRPIDPSWARDACRCAECRDPGTDQHLVDATMLDGWTVVRTDRSDDRLEVTLHHRSGERHVCRIPKRNQLTCEPSRGRRRSRSGSVPTARVGPATAAHSSISWRGAASHCYTTAGSNPQRCWKLATRSGSCAKPTTAAFSTS